jgi:RNA polymerase sigma factor (sigma-70 family)
MERHSTPNVAPADRDLLRAFVERADEAAFAELVARHGSLVLGACRRVLADAPDSEDAFQATFMILARKAGTIRQPERLGAWLYGVALRCAFRIRKATRRAKEQPMPNLPAPASQYTQWADVRPVLDMEISRLPEKLRTALVLCELEGLDRATAAERLGVPVGTVSSRLSRAKEALRRRLVRRGITLTLAGLGLMLTQVASAAVPPPLISATAAACVRFAAGAGAGPAAKIATEVMRAVRTKFVARAAIMLGLLGAVVLGGVILFWPVDDQRRIQGEWKVSSFRFAGNEMADAPELAGVNAIIDGETIDYGFAMRYAIDPSQSPKAIDVKVPTRDGEAALFMGIYELTRDRLTIHVSQPGFARPTTLFPADESQSVIFVMERVRNR